jgi:CBS domain containing-hemolysin-like protein
MIKGSFYNIAPHQLIMTDDEEELETNDTVILLNRAYFKPAMYMLQLTLQVLFFMVGVLLFDTVYQFPPEFTVLAVVVTLAVLMLLEFTVQGIVFPHLEQWAERLTPLAKFFTGIMRPFTAFYMTFLGSPEVVSSVLEPDFEDELKNWALEEREVEEEPGDLEQDERMMVYSIFQLSDTLCREIMVPRIELFSLEESMHLLDAAKRATESGHSRIPVYRDHIDNITGILYVKDLLKVVLEHPEDDLPSIRDLLRPTYFVPESKKVTNLLQEMRMKEVHLAVVVDEYGGTAGLVTLEDIVEEIVGEIRDEYDQGEELPFEQLGDLDYIFQGRIDLDDFNQYMGTKLDSTEADTLSGYVYLTLGRVPAAGDVVEVVEEGLTLTVQQVAGRSISKVRAVRVGINSGEELNGNGNGKSTATKTD